MSLLNMLWRTKVGLLVLGLLLLASGGTAFAMSAGQSPLGQLGGSLATGSAPTSAAPTHTPTAQDQGDQSANHLAVEGTLVSASATAITVRNESKTWTIAVNASTRVNGEHAESLADLAAAIGHKVQVQAGKQSNGSFLASKVTVQGAEPGGHGDGEHGDHGQHGDGEHGQSGDHGQSQNTGASDD